MMSSASEMKLEAGRCRPAALAAETAASEPPLTVLQRQSGWRWLDLGALWRYRELLFFLAWRDVKVRYKQTALGAAWAVLQPFATMVVFSLFLGRMAGIDTGDTPYPLFVFAGVLPWLFFANALSSASQSVVGNERLVTKIYFPRLIIPMASVAAALVDFFVAFGMLLVLMLYYGVCPSGGIVLVPLLLAGLVLSALGIGTLLSALTVAYRDFRYVVPFAVQLWMFATPCIYLNPTKALGPTARALLPLNPAYGLIANLRAAILGGSSEFDLYALAVSLSVGLLLLLAGCLYFRRVERSFADII
jgi:lipopolysaccharide transport system permease protein